MPALVLRILAAVGSYGLAAYSATKASPVFRYPAAETGVMIIGWTIMFGVALFCALALSLGVSRQLLHRDR